jgi:hypothetical protein
MIRRQESILLQRANTGQQPSSSSIGTVGMGGNSNLSMDGTRGISVRLEKMLCETRGAFALENDSDVLKDIRQAFIELLVAAADPQADLSWTVSDPRAYKMLPLKIIECRDWNALRMLMCDLRFLWRSMVETGPTSILTNYQVCPACLISSSSQQTHTHSCMLEICNISPLHKHTFIHLFMHACMNGQHISPSPSLPLLPFHLTSSYISPSSSLDELNSLLVPSGLFFHSNITSPLWPAAMPLFCGQGQLTVSNSSSSSCWV